MAIPIQPMTPAGAPWIADFVTALRNELALHLHPRGLEMLRASGGQGSVGRARERALQPAAPPQPGAREQREPEARAARLRQAPGDAPADSSVSPSDAGSAPALASSSRPDSPGMSVAPASTTGAGRVTGRIEMMHAARPGGEPGRAEHAANTAAATLKSDRISAARPRPVTRSVQFVQQAGAVMQEHDAPEPRTPAAAIEVAGQSSGHAKAMAPPTADRQGRDGSMIVPVGGIERLAAAPVRSPAGRGHEPAPAEQPVGRGPALVPAGSAAGQDRDAVPAPGVPAPVARVRDLQPDNELSPTASASGETAADEAAAITMLPAHNAAGRLVENDTSAQMPGSARAAAPDARPGMLNLAASPSASARPAAPVRTSAVPMHASGPSSTSPSPWRTPAPAAAQASTWPAAPSAAPIGPQPAVRLEPPPAALAQHDEVERMSRAAGVPAGLPGDATTLIPESAPWPRSSTSVDAPETGQRDDNELARHMLRILIAEARREGLEL